MSVCVQVALLRDYLGEAVIGAYLARRADTIAQLCDAGSGLGMTKVDAEVQVASYEQQQMLTWMDALWSCFLEVRSIVGNCVVAIDCAMHVCVAPTCPR